MVQGGLGPEFPNFPDQPSARYTPLCCCCCCCLQPLLQGCAYFKPIRLVGSPKVAHCTITDTSHRCMLPFHLQCVKHTPSLPACILCYQLPLEETGINPLMGSVFLLCIRRKLGMRMLVWVISMCHLHISTRLVQLSQYSSDRLPHGPKQMRS